MGLPDGVVGLPLPIKVYDLVNTVEMISRHRAGREESAEKRYERETILRDKIIDQAESASDRTK